MNRADEHPVVPPLAQPMEVTDPLVPIVEDPRGYPTFVEAYARVCRRTMPGLDAMFAAESMADVVPIVESEHQALVRRIASVHDREDLWTAADPLVME